MSVLPNTFALWSISTPDNWPRQKWSCVWTRKRTCNHARVWHRLCQLNPHFPCESNMSTGEQGPCICLQLLILVAVKCMLELIHASVKASFLLSYACWI